MSKKYDELKKQFDPVIKEVENQKFESLPHELISNIDKWKWGSYGWTSPTSLLLSAALYKHLNPDKDCCKIWAKDETKKTIPGGYSIRALDEYVTIPLLAKYDLCTDFCSPNSGMQGSRAIEKMRTEKRLNINFASTQATVFDLKLFATIMNQINELNSTQSLDVFKYFIQIAKTVQSKRLKTNVKLQQEVNKNFQVLNFLSSTADPELTKCVVAACLKLIITPKGLTLSGVEDYKTAADARAQKPGDLAISSGDNTLVAVEVKDKTQTIDWKNIDRAKNILNNNPGLEAFVFILENRNATVTDTVQEIITSKMLKADPASKIIISSLHDLFLLTMTTSTEQDIANMTGIFMTKATAIKPETKEKWVNEMQL